MSAVQFMSSAGPDVSKKDFSDELQLLIPESVLLANTRGLDTAIVSLLSLEKRCRAHNDTHTLKALCVHLIRLCRERADWTKLNSTLSLLSNRRNQSKFAISAMVEEGLSYIEHTPDKSSKIALIDTLRVMCEGKMYLEAESARLHLLLALLRERESDLAGACEIIQDVHVETYGSLSKREKAEYILQQIRLNLRRGDHVRALIHSRKMNKRTLDDPDDSLDAVKVAFYRLMVQFHLKDNNYWEVCQCYYKIYDTALTKASPEAVSLSLSSCISFLLLSRYNNAQSDLLHRLSQLKEAQRACPQFISSLTLFKTNEIIPSPFASQSDVTAQLEQCCRAAALVALEVPELHVTSDSNTRIGSEMTAEGHAAVVPALGVTGTVLQTEREHGSEAAISACVAALHNRVVEHNIRVLSRYYTQIRTARAAHMLGLSEQALETHLAEMALPVVGAEAVSEEVADGTGLVPIYIRINRPAGVVSFSPQLKPEATLSDWASGVGGLLGLMETTCHLINRENMVYKV